MDVSVCIDNAFSTDFTSLHARTQLWHLSTQQTHLALCPLSSPLFTMSPYPSPLVISSVHPLFVIPQFLSSSSVIMSSFSSLLPPCPSLPVILFSCHLCSLYDVLFTSSPFPPSLLLFLFILIAYISPSPLLHIKHSPHSSSPNCPLLSSVLMPLPAL